MTTPLYLLRAFQLGISLADLEGLEVGDVIDLMTEAQNDNCEYDSLPTQADFDKF